MAGDVFAGGIVAGFVVFYIIFVIAMMVVPFIIIYFIVKNGIKNGTVEAQKKVEFEEWQRYGKIICYICKRREYSVAEHRCPYCDGYGKNDSDIAAMNGVQLGEVLNKGDL